MWPKIVSFFMGVILVVIFYPNDYYYRDYLSLPLPYYMYADNTSNLNTKNPPHESTITRWKYTDIKKEKLCLAKNIYFEARGQDLRGQIAVALVTFNRVNSPRFPDSICGVVWQKGRSKKTGKYVAQFSWTLDHISNTPPNTQTWKNVQRLVTAIMDENSISNIVDFTEGSQYYHTKDIDPYWNDSMTMVATIDDHIFYKY